MSEQLLHKIRERYSQLSPQQRHLAEYILDHYDQIAFFSVEEMAKKAGVSTATVVRFAQSLGYEGFGEIRGSAQRLLISPDKETPSERLTQAIKDVQEANGYIARSFKEDILNLEMTIQEFSLQVFERIVEKISKVRKIYLVGFGSCYSISYFLYFHLTRLAFDAEIITSGGTQLFEKLAYIGPEDMLIVISFPRYSVDSFNSLDYAKKNGVYSVLITDRRESVLSEVTTEVLVAKGKTTGFVNSFVSAMALCNALILMVGLKDRNRSIDSLKKLDFIKSEYHLYV